ncbi:Glycosyltransferase family 92 protein [Trichostrongylus colubriformis]|uniref:Glycosyltransferase family 92 protein n=1 Tax=Trichostrongylus colubriformis TaxID=6319 RepID=A0AAN8IIU3_TRICO
MRWNWAVVIPILALGIISFTFYNIDAGRHGEPDVGVPFSMELLPKHTRSNLAGAGDRFDDHIRSCVPFYHLMQQHINTGTGNRNQPFRSMTLVGAYMFPDYSVVTTEADGRFNQTVFCRYLDVNLNEIVPAVESVVFPEFTVYCCKRSKAHYMSVTTTKDEEINQTVPVTDRSIDDPIYTLSMCVKPMYGVSTKFLLFAEYIEHYKLQGVQHFYIYVKDVDPYTEKLIKYYVKSGEAEVVYFREEQDRPSIEWHLVGTQDCIHRSRHHSKYTIYADMDERILPENSYTTLAAYTARIMAKRENIGMIRFVTQYILKNSTDPVVYEGEKTLNEHMPTLVFHNSSTPAPIGHTAKCIIDPKKVFLMWVHHVEIYFPGYNGYEVPINEGIIKHYRDIMLGDWYKYYLPDVENFGPFTVTFYPPVFMEPLYRNLKKKLDLVYTIK